MVYNQHMPPGTNKTIDFTVLDRLKQPLVEASTLLALLPLFVFMPLIAIVLSPTYGIFFILIAGGVFLVTVVFRNDQMKSYNESVLLSFAEQNGLGYGLPVIDPDQLPGTLFTHGHSKIASKPISGTINEYPFTLFEYMYATGSGKNRRKYDAAVMEIVLPRVLPHMVIDSLVEQGDFGSSTLPIVFDSSQRIALEGDFHEYFSLYAPDTYGVSALTIIAPDAMEALMRHAALCDIEIIDNRLYLYWPLLPRYRKNYEDMFTTTQEILKEIGAKLSRGDIFAHESQARVHSASQTKGVRLKQQRFRVATMLTVAMYAGFQLLSKMHNPPTILFVAFYAVVGAVVITILYRYNKRRQLEAELRLRYKKYQ